MKEKLDILCAKYNLSASALAKALGVEASAISHIRSGRNKPSYDFVIKILRAFPDINPDWLLLNSPEVLREGASAAPLSPGVADDLSASLFGNDNNNETSASLEKPKNDISDIFSNPSKAGKRAQRVIIIFSDGSFESYESL